MQFYRERNGDYLCVNPRTAYKAQRRFFTQIEGRATAIAGLIGSVSTTKINTRFLKQCKRVKREEVPQEWLTALVGEEQPFN